MQPLTQFTLSNSYEIVFVIMAGYLLVALAYVLIRETRLLKSPLIRALVLTAATGGVAAITFGSLRPVYHNDSEVMPWLEHLTIQFAGVFAFAIVVQYLAKRLRPHLSTRSTLSAIFKAGPFIIIGGWLIATLLLLLVPAPAPDLGTDLSLYGYTYRLLVQLPALCYALFTCCVWLTLLRNFGPATTPDELVLKKRLLPITVAVFSWALLYANHLLWPLVASLWPSVTEQQSLNNRIETLVPPILLLNVLSWLWAVLRPYSPVNLFTRKSRFQRYRTLSETMSLVIDGPLGRTWRLRHHFERTKRIMELTCERLGLPPGTASNALKIYALSALAVDPPFSAAPAIVSFRYAKLGRQQLEELATLHQDFLNEPDTSPRKIYALGYPYPNLLPKALMLVTDSPPLPLRSYPPELQLAAAAVNAELLPTTHGHYILHPSQCSTSEPVLLAYRRAETQLSSHVTT